MYVFTTMEAEGVGWDLVKLAQAPKYFITDRSKVVLSLWYCCDMFC